MQAPQQVADSLWHCLCPSFARTLRSNFPRASRPRPSPRPSPSYPPRPPTACLQSRRYKVAAEPADLTRIQSVVPAGYDKPEELSRIARIFGFVPQFDIYPKAASPGVTDAYRGRFLRRLRRYGSRDTGTILRVLRDASFECDPLAVENWVRFLITKRGHKPDGTIYEALLRACCHSQYGSVARIKGLLEEMEHNGVPLDHGTCGAALRALSIHPGYTLRADLLQHMRDNWIDLTPESMHDVCCGLLREKQIEMALDTLDVMQRQHGFAPRTHLLTMFVYVLAELGEFETLSDIFLQRRDPRHAPPSKLLWLTVLTKAAEHMHYPTVATAWNLKVSPGDLNPSTGVANMVLDTAARAGDSELAMDVFRILSQRNSPIHPYQQETLIEAHLRAESVDMLKVLRYIASLERNSPGTIGKVLRPPFLIYFRDHPQEIEPTIDHLRDLRRKNEDLFPIELLNTVIEAAIRSSRFGLAMNTYTSLHTFSASGITNPATLSTFKILLSACQSQPRKETAMFLAAEMIALKIQPDATVYEYLILACLAGNGEDSAHDRATQKRHFADAYRFLSDMLAGGHVPKEIVWDEVSAAAAKIGDEYAERVQQQMTEHRVDTRYVKRLRRDYQHAPFPWVLGLKNEVEEPEESLKQLGYESRSG